MVPAVLVALLGLSACGQHESNSDSSSSKISTEHTQKSKKDTKHKATKKNSSAVQSSSSTQSNSNQENEHNSASKDPESSTTSTTVAEKGSLTSAATQGNSNYSNSVSSSTSNNTASNAKTINITSAAEAESYLKQKLHLEGNTDISYGNSDTYNGYDRYGKYFTVSLTSISDRVKGYTGSIATYKVYQDGNLVKIQG